jgi:hypothetical protein
MVSASWPAAGADAPGALARPHRAIGTDGLRLLPRPRHHRGPDDVAVLWSAEQTCALGQPPCAGTWFGIHTPIPQTIVDMSLFVAVLSGLYFTVSTSVDPLYRQRFFDPLVADVAVSLAGRDAFLHSRERTRDPLVHGAVRATLTTVSTIGVQG